MTSINGKYILLTGGSRGIGPLIANELAKRGAHLSTILPGYINEVGMFARFNLKSPGILGSTNPEKVTKAVVKAIEEEKLEMFVNSSPARLLSVACEISPSLCDWLKKALGLVDFQRKKVGKRL